MGKKIKFNKSEEERIIKLYNQAEISMNNIGKMFNCGYKPIIRVLEKRGILYPNKERISLILSRNLKGKEGPNKKSFSKDEIDKIINLYEKEYLSAIKIGKIFNCSSPTILNILKQNNSITDMSHRKKLLYSIGKLKSARIKIKDEEDIKNILNLYNKELMSCEKIGNLYHVDSKTISRLLNKNGIKICNSDRFKILFKAGKLDFSKNLGKYNIKGEMVGKKSPSYGKPKSELLINILKSRKGETKENSDWARKISETKIKQGRWKLQNNPTWNNGSSFEPYGIEFNKEFKNLVRLRDNFCCLNCGISEQKHLILTNRRLAIHHIDYNKLNTCLLNCCALCNRCHSLTNLKNRSEWKSLFQEKLSKLYNYKYDEKGNIIIDSINILKGGV